MEIYCEKCKRFTIHKIMAASSIHYQSTVGRGGKSDYVNIKCKECKKLTKDVDLSHD